MPNRKSKAKTGPKSERAAPAKPAHAPPPPPPPPPPPRSIAELMETARRIQAQSEETIRQLAALQEQIRIAREGGGGGGGDRRRSV